MYGNDGYRGTKIRIGDEPIKEGFYPWGWVNYSKYSTTSDYTQKNVEIPTIEIAILNDVYSPRKAKTVKKDFDSLDHPIKNHINITFFLALVCLTFLAFTDLANTSWSFIFSVYGIYLIFRRQRNLNKIMLYNMAFDETATNYPVGQKLMKSLKNPQLKTDDFFAYHDLRLCVKELKDFFDEEESYEYDDED